MMENKGMINNNKIARVSTHKFSKKQHRFIFDRKRFVLFSGGVGSGKTMAGCYKSILFSLNNAGSVGLIGTQTYVQLADTTLVVFMEIIEHIEKQNQSIKLIKKFDKSRLVMKLFNDSVIYWRTLDDESKLRSYNLSYFYIDEASTVKENIFLRLTDRIRLGDIQQGFLTTNPDTTTHWIYRHFIDNPNPAKFYSVHYVSSKDNIHLPENYVEQFDYYDEDYRRRFVEGQWGIVEGLVYKQFNEAVHVKKLKIDKRWKYFVRGVDYGFTNPFVCLFVAIDGDGTVYVFDEYYRKKHRIDDNVNNVCNMYPDIKFRATYVDESSPETITSFGEKQQMTIPADRDVVAGIHCVMSKLHVQNDGEPRLYIHPRCKNLIKELYSYKWADEDSKKNTKEEPIKKDDHGPDAIRYVIYSIFKRKGKIHLRKDVRPYY
jgi:phage terminase large subunit